MFKKRELKGKTPKEIFEILAIYKEAVGMPIDDFATFLKHLDKDQIHTFVIQCDGTKVSIAHDESEHKKWKGKKS